MYGNNMYLIDKSVISRLHIPEISKCIKRIGNNREVATCGIIEIEIMYSARNNNEFNEILLDRTLSYEWIPTFDSDLKRAIEVQGMLSQNGYLRAISIPDLIIAVIAERTKNIILHYDKDFDLLSEMINIKTEWVVEKGTV